MDEPFKKCPCGRSYTKEAWEKLHRLPNWDFEDEILEVRNCVCGSTISVQIFPAPPLSRFDRV